MRRTLVAEVGSAFGLLTRLPVGHLVPEGTDHARAVWAYPVAGAAVGAWGALVYGGVAACGLPPAVAALWTLAAQVLATGGLHEDGLADTADGLGGGRTPERRLAIMRDSRIGSFGAMALVLTFGVRAAAIAGLAEPGRVAVALVAAGALGRAAILLVLLRCGPARPDGLAATLAGVPRGAALAGLAIAVATAALVQPPLAVLAAAGLAAAAGLGMAALGRWLLGGYTGDLLGAVVVLAECLMLSALTR